MKGRKIILAVTGSIAAYKAAHLIRLLVKQSAEVKVLMTESAKAFISPLTLSTLSKNDVLSEIIDESSWNNHVELGLWADAMIIAPATANTLAKMANGICDNIVNAVYLSAKCPVFFAPAMDLDMWKHQSTQDNILKLLSFGNQLIDVNEGELASGLVGKGRMAEPEEILDILQSFFDKKKDLDGKSILITAGPTYEPIDPVRFIGNHSSGKMGIALAEECAQRGAKVELILGPSKLSAHHSRIKTTKVQTADEMYENCKNLHSSVDVCIFAAAVADYKASKTENRKIKKKEKEFEIQLTKNVDIAQSLGQEKQSHQIHIGFALETNNEEFHAQQKLEKKNFDFIVLNSLNDKGAGFKHGTNKITIFTSGDEKIPYDLKSKREVAVDIIDTLVEKHFNSAS